MVDARIRVSTWLDRIVANAPMVTLWTRTAKHAKVLISPGSTFYTNTFETSMNAPQTTAAVRTIATTSTAQRRVLVVAVLSWAKINDSASVTL